MIHHLKSAVQSRLMRAILVGAYGQGIQIGLQLLGVPVMIAMWGTASYGVWLALYLVPSYLVMADFGLTTAAANDMAMKMTRGEVNDTRRVFQALRVLVGVVTGSLLLIFVGCIYGPGAHWLDFAQKATQGHAQITTLLLMVYGLTALSNGTVNAGYRAVDRFALGGTIFQTVFLFESAMLLAAVAMGASMMEAAAVIMAIRIIGSLITTVWLRTHFGWLFARKEPVSLAQLKRLLRPAMGSMALPFANVTALQGPILLITSVVGSVWVPMFTTARTLTRFPLQLTLVMSSATVTRFSVAHAAHHQAQKARLLLVNLAVAAGLLIPAAAGVMVLGQWLIRHWTRGAIEVDMRLLGLLTAAMLANGTWTMLSNFLIAINKQDLFAYTYAALAAGMFFLGKMLAPAMGVVGIGVSVLMADLAMLGWLIVLVARLRIVDPVEFRAQMQAALAYVSRAKGAAQ